MYFEIELHERWLVPELDAPFALARVACALSGLALAIGWERTRPYRRVPRQANRAWANLGLWGVGAALAPLLPLVVGLAAAAWAASAGVGLLHQLAVPWPVALLATVLVLDATSWLLHRLYHALPLLWRVHRIHHSDIHLSATTGVRFHPLEVALSACVRAAAVVALGADALGVAAFEGLLLLASQLQHADVRLPSGVEVWLRRVLVTPDLHRIHHSLRRQEADSNYGTVLTLWDRLGGTLRTEPAPARISVGLPDGPAADPDSLVGLLALPFRSTRGAPLAQSTRCAVSARESLAPKRNAG